jgi:hypothetical protein
MLLLRKRMLIRHCWTLPPLRQMLLKRFRMLQLRKVMPHKPSLTLLLLRRTLRRLLLMLLLPLPLPVPQFLMLLTLRLVTSWQGLGQEPTLPSLLVLTDKFSLLTPRVSQGLNGLRVVVVVGSPAP